MVVHVLCAFPSLSAAAQLERCAARRFHVRCAASYVTIGRDISSCHRRTVMNLPSPFPVVHSVLAPHALLTHVLPGYDIPAPHSCFLLTRSMNDTYLVRSVNANYILRIYRAGWRSQDDILFEVDALRHLERYGVSVAPPLPRGDGTFLTRLDAPEGTRYAVLFAYAPGGPLTPIRDHCFHYGRAVAALHHATDHFTSTHARFSLDLDHLLAQPLLALQPLLADYAAAWRYLNDTGALLRGYMTKLARHDLPRGFCHGDLYPANAYITDNHVVTLFDFDCCGMGWRAYDLAVFRYEMVREPADLWDAFLNGYQSEHPVSQREVDAIPWLVALRTIWHMGLYAHNGQEFMGGQGKT